MSDNYTDRANKFVEAMGEPWELYTANTSPLGLFVINNTNGGRWIIPFAIVDLFEKQQDEINRLTKLVDNLEKSSVIADKIIDREIRNDPFRCK